MLYIYTVPGWKYMFKRLPVPYTHLAHWKRHAFNLHLPETEAKSDQHREGQGRMSTLPSVTVLPQHDLVIRWCVIGPVVSNCSTVLLSLKTSWCLLDFVCPFVCCMFLGLFAHVYEYNYWHTTIWLLVENLCFFLKRWCWLVSASVPFLSMVRHLRHWGRPTGLAHTHGVCPWVPGTSK